MSEKLLKHDQIDIYHSNDIVNNSTVVGTKVTDALNNLKNNIPDTYTQIVYVNSTSPSTATIFDIVNPPITNNNALKNDVTNLYVGTDASTWVYQTSPAGYITKTITSTTSNFNLEGTSTDAGGNKTADIQRTGKIKAGGFKVDGTVGILKSDGAVDLTNYERVSNKNTVNGYPGLGADSKILASQLPLSKVKNSANVDQFTYALDQGIQFAGSGDTTVSFDGANKRITITSIPGSGGGGAVTSFNGRTGGVVAIEGDYSLNLLGDVQITSATNNDFLQYDSALTQWRNRVLNTSVVPELTNLYYTNARGIGSVLTGYTPSPGTVAATDTILQAFNKVNGNINLKANLASPTFTGVFTLGTDPLAPSGGYSILTRNSSTGVFSMIPSNSFRVEGGDIDWTDLINKPTTFTPSPHTHLISDVTGLQTTLDNKAALVHSHSISDVTGLQGALNNKQDLITELTTNFLPKWNGSAFGSSQVFDNGTNIGFGTTIPASRIHISKDASSLLVDGLRVDRDPSLTSSAIINGFGGATNLISNGGQTGTFGITRIMTSDGTTSNEICRFTGSGRTLFNTTTDNGVDQVQVNGTVSASPATTANQVVVKSQLDAAVSSGTYTPTITGATNISINTPTVKGNYVKVGNIVSVQVNIEGTPTANQGISFACTVPFNRVGSGVFYMGGASVFDSGASSNIIGTVRMANGVNTAVTVTYRSASATNPHYISLNFQYDVTQ